MNKWGKSLLISTNLSVQKPIKVSYYYSKRKLNRSIYSLTGGLRFKSNQMILSRKSWRTLTTSIESLMISNPHRKAFLKNVLKNLLLIDSKNMNMSLNSSPNSWMKKTWWKYWLVKLRFRCSINSIGSRSIALN